MRSVPTPGGGVDSRQLFIFPDLLEGLEVREGTNFIEECIHRQVRASKPTTLVHLQTTMEVWISNM